jgi:hypothetical protein
LPGTSRACSTWMLTYPWLTYPCPACSLTGAGRYPRSFTRRRPHRGTCMASDPITLLPDHDAAGEAKAAQPALAGLALRIAAPALQLARLLAQLLALAAPEAMGKRVVQGAYRFLRRACGDRIQPGAVRFLQRMQVPREIKGGWPLASGPVRVLRARQGPGVGIACRPRPVTGSWLKSRSVLYARGTVFRVVTGRTGRTPSSTFSFSLPRYASCVARQRRLRKETTRKLHIPV